jgi:hypothetical protein
MEQQAKDLRNEYLRNWRKKNKDKVKAAQQRYWENKVKNLNDKGVNEHGE